MFLGVETSCDETAAAVLDADGVVLSNIVASQDIHRIYEGVVPEIASREHVRLLVPTLRAALGGDETRGRQIAHDFRQVMAGNGELAGDFIGREALLMSISLAQNRRNPPPVPDWATVTRTSP